MINATLTVAVALLVARLGLAAVFGVAGLAKLRDRSGTREMLIAFGVPLDSVGVLSTLLPLAELILAAALVLSLSARWSALGACALLVVFSCAIGVSLARGRKPDCRCFGQLGAAPVGPRTLARNIVLLLIASFIALGDPTHSDSLVFAWLGSHVAWTIVGLVVFGIVAVQSLVVLEMLRQQGRMLLRIEQLEGASRHFASNGHSNGVQSKAGLPVGSPAPSFTLPTLEGTTVTLADLRLSGNPVALFFVHPGCGPCIALLPEIAAWQRDLSQRLTVAIISELGVAENLRSLGGLRLQNVLIQEHRAISDSYQSSATPAALIIKSDGAIGSGIAAGAVAIRELIEAANARSVESVNPKATV